MNWYRVFLMVFVFEIASGAVWSQTNVAAPPLPPLRSPVDTFREYLSMSAAELTKALSERTPERQMQLRAKIDEYRKLSADERELRLQATELRWWLLSLMRQPATNDSVGLAMVPTNLQAMVATRLTTWRQLFLSEMQQEFLDNEDVRELFVGVEKAGPSQLQKKLNSLTPERRKTLEAGLERWTAMSPEERNRMRQNIEQFFAFDTRERAKVLRTLSESERQQMETTLNAFAGLTPEQRRTCVLSFEKFASMTVVERAQFLRNAERWANMTLEERQRWRDLVKKVPQFPPLPHASAGRMPNAPMPPGALPPPPPATNGG